MRHSAAAGIWCFSSHRVSSPAASWVQSFPPVTKSGFLDCARASARAPASVLLIPPAATGMARVQGRINLCADDVLRQAHHHWAGTAAHGREHCLRDDLGGPLGVVEDHHAFGARVEPRLDVELLERLAVPVRKRNQSDKEQHRSGVLPGGVQADVGVRCPGSPRDHGDAGTLVHLAVGLGHVGGAALVSADHSFDVRAVQPVEDVQEAFPGDNKGAFHPVRHERINNHVAGGLEGAGAVEVVQR